MKVVTNHRRSASSRSVEDEPSFAEKSNDLNNTKKKKKKSSSAKVDDLKMYGYSSTPRASYTLDECNPGIEVDIVVNEERQLLTTKRNRFGKKKKKNDTESYYKYSSKPREICTTSEVEQNDPGIEVDLYIEPKTMTTASKSPKSTIVSPLSFFQHETIKKNQPQEYSMRRTKSEPIIDSAVDNDTNHQLTASSSSHFHTVVDFSSSFDNLRQYWNSPHEKNKKKKLTWYMTEDHLPYQETATTSSRGESRCNHSEDPHHPNMMQAVFFDHPM